MIIRLFLALGLFKHMINSYNFHPRPCMFFLCVLLDIHNQKAFIKYVNFKGNSGGPSSAEETQMMNGNRLVYDQHSAPSMR